MYSKETNKVSIGEHEINLIHAHPASTLQLSHGAILKNVILMRSGALDTFEKCEELVKLADTIKRTSTIQTKNLRLSSMQLNTLGDEWPVVQRQHYAFIKVMKEKSKRNLIAHISLPTEYLVYGIKPRLHSPYMQAALLRIQQQFNAEAWITYCAWLCEEMEEGLKKIKSSEAYTLQARFEDFKLEVHSHFLQALLEEIENALIAQQQKGVQSDKNRIFELEKIAVSGREKLKDHLQIQCGLLKIISETLDTLKKPELHKIKMIADLLYALMAPQLKKEQKEIKNWGQHLLMIQLLDEYLGVCSAINCDTGLDRTNLVFALRLAVAELSQEISHAEMFNLSNEWHGYIVNSHATRLRMLFWENFKALHLSFAGKKVITPKTNSDLLVFLPATIKHSVGGNLKDVPLLRFNTETNQPEGLSKAAEKLFKIS